MTDPNDKSESDDEALKATFKEAAEEVIEDADFVTASELDKRLSELQTSKEDDEDSDGEEAPDNVSDATDTEAVDTDSTEGGEDDDEEEKADVDPDEIEDPDDDEEEELDLDPTEEDDEMPPEEPEVDPEGDTDDPEGVDDGEEETQKMGREEVLDFLEGEVPDDICEAVEDHLGGDELDVEDDSPELDEVGEPEEEDEGALEASKSDGDAGEQPAESAVAKAGPSDYVESTTEDWINGAGTPSPDEEEVRKSTDEQPDADSPSPDEDDTGVEKSSDKPGLTGAFYSNIPDSTEHAD